MSASDAPSPVEIDLGDFQRADERPRAAMQRAIGELAAAGGGTLYLPPGRYVISRPLLVTGEYVAITGDPGAVVHLHLAEAGTVDGSTNVFTLCGEILRAHFRGLTIIGPGLGTAEPATGRGACIGTEAGAVVHSLVVEDCVLSERAVGVRLHHQQNVAGPFHFRRNRLRRVVRGVELSTDGGESWTGVTARDVRFERNHVRVEGGRHEEPRGLATVATLGVRLTANTVSGGAAFEQASPWLDGRARLSSLPPERATEFPRALLTASGLDPASGRAWDLRQRIQARYNVAGHPLHGVHDLAYNVFDARRAGAAGEAGGQPEAAAPPCGDVAPRQPVEKGNLIVRASPSGEVTYESSPPMSPKLAALLDDREVPAVPTGYGGLAALLRGGGE
jgi:hypothetical protein